MLFSIVGKIKKIILFSFIVILTGCSLLNFGFKLNIKPLNIPPHVGYILSKSSGYITVIDTKGDSVIGKEQVARRDNMVLAEIGDFLIHRSLIYVTLSDRNVKDKSNSSSSDVIRILNLGSGEIEESKVGFSPDKIYPIGDNLAFVSSDVFYYSNDSGYNYIYDLDNKKVIDTLAFPWFTLVSCAVTNGDTVIMLIEPPDGIQYFLLYSIRQKCVISPHIDFINTNEEGSNNMIVQGDQLYACGTKHIMVFSLSNLVLEKSIDLPGNNERLPQSAVAVHNKLYITYYDANGYNRIDVVDMNGNNQIKQIDIPEGGAEYIDYSRDLDRMFVASYLGGHVYKIDPNSDSITDVINTGEEGEFSVIHVEDR